MISLKVVGRLVTRNLCPAGLKLDISEWKSDGRVGHTFLVSLSTADRSFLALCLDLTGDNGPLAGDRSDTEVLFPTWIWQADALCDLPLVGLSDFYQHNSSLKCSVINMQTVDRGWVLLSSMAKQPFLSHRLPKKILPGLSRIRPSDFHFFRFPNNNFLLSKFFSLASYPQRGKPDLAIFELVSINTM
jgi:hypothetical protein